MRSTDSKLSDLLPRIVERAAKRSDEKEEEPWIKPRKQTAELNGPNVSARLPAGLGVALLSFLLFPGLLSFIATGVIGAADYGLAGKGGQFYTLHCIGAPLVHTARLNHFGSETQFFGAAIFINGLLWVGITAGVWWCLWAGVGWWLALRKSGQRQFTLGQLLALSVGVAMALAAWRWDLAAWVPWQTDLATVEKAIEGHRPIGPGIQPLIRFSILAAGYAYLGVGCAASGIVSFLLWVVRQFLPRRPGEDKSLLQQIF